MNGEDRKMEGCAPATPPWPIPPPPRPPANAEPGTVISRAAIGGVSRRRSNFIVNPLLARNVSAAQRTPSVTGFCRYRILMNADDNVVADSIDGFRGERETDLRKAGATEATEPMAWPVVLLARNRRMLARKRRAKNVPVNAPVEGRKQP